MKRPPSSVAKPALSAPTPGIARAISKRQLYNVTLKAANSSHAKFESRKPEDEHRRRNRQRMRATRARVVKEGHTRRSVGQHGRLSKARSVAKPAPPRSLGKPKKNILRAAARAVAKRAPGKNISPCTATTASDCSRHMPTYCCGRRRFRCVCFTQGRGREIALSVNGKALKSIASAIRESRVQTWKDTADMPAYVKQIGWQDDFRYSWLFPIAFLWRHFSNEHFWEALRACQGVKPNQRPDFNQMEKVMRHFHNAGVPYHGGLFYSGSSLTHYRTATNSKWCPVPKGMDFIAKEVLSLKIAWDVASSLHQRFDELQEQHTRQRWKACTQDFLKAIQAHTRGAFGHYALKITLDGVLLSRPCLNKVISWWPMKCPAYSKALPDLYTQCTTSETDLFLAACHFQGILKQTFPKFTLKDALAQTCWLERGITASPANTRERVGEA